MSEENEFWEPKRRQFWRKDRPRGPRGPRGPRSPLNLVTGVLAIATALGLVLLWPHGAAIAKIPGLDIFKTAYQAKVTSATDAPCPGTTPGLPTQCVSLRAELLDGPEKGHAYIVEFPIPKAGAGFDVGEHIYLVRTTAAGELRYSYLDRARVPSLWWLAILFAIAVVVLGRLRGLGALVGLVASFFFLLKFMLPSIIEGHSPVLVSLIAASAIAFFALYLAQGFGRTTTVALLGTVGALVITASLGALWVRLSHFTGLGSEEAFIVQLGVVNIDLVGVLLAGIIIGSLGALDDVSVTQAAAVDEIRKADPTISKWALYRGGLRIGRDHVASIVNTLVLAYAGASLPLLMLFLISEQSTGLVLNSEAVAAEIVRSLVGSIGLVACVPLTTWLASQFPEETRQAADDEEQRDTGRHRGRRVIRLGRPRPRPSPRHSEPD